jgi:hypothetical protein
MKKLLIPIMVFSLLCIAFIPPVEAGEKSRHRWQGIAIGAASFVFLDHLANHSAGPARSVSYGPAPGAYGSRLDSPRHCAPGAGHRKNKLRRQSHWESVWIPGHYDNSGRYIDGHHERYNISSGRYRYR